jgi:hypothetical protein
LTANIPLKKMENQLLREFLEKYIGKNMPSESTLRKKNVPLCYDEVMGSIKETLSEGSLWVSADCARDSMGSEVANVIVGKLDSKKFHPPFLVKVAFLETADSATMARVINDTFREIDPNFDGNRARILLSDAAPYMVKCGKSLQVFFPRLLHLTCLEHALSLVCRKAEEIFPDVNCLIASIKSVFVKAPTHRAAYKESCPDLPMPPPSRS